MNFKKDPIGIFDSGMGGITVLVEAMKLMPTENFIYYGDSLNAPYGTRSREKVKELSLSVCEFLISKKVKAIVVACNTATSATISDIRKVYSVPVIGMEPALKPAINAKGKGSIAVLATEVTLREDKFNNLMNRFSDDRAIIKIACPSLVELVESGVISGQEAEKEVLNCFKDIDLENLSAVVLGCTHFVFLKKIFRTVLGDDIEIHDGNDGTIKYLYKKLDELSLLNLDNESPIIEIYNSKDQDYLYQSRVLLEKYKAL
ncbi:MAG: glutamate racemase [Acidaminobacteraceae bacterium]